MTGSVTKKADKFVRPQADKEWSKIVDAVVNAEYGARAAFAALDEFDSRGPAKGGQKAYDAWMDKNHEERGGLEYAALDAAQAFIDAHAAQEDFFDREPLTGAAPATLAACALDEYMTARAAHEGQAYDLTADFYRQQFERGVREFFGVTVCTAHGKLVRDEQNPEFFDTYFSQAHAPKVH